MSCKKFDVIIFGASGFVGQCTVLQAVELLKDLKWAIAGKSAHKLQLVLDQIALKSGKNLDNIPIFVANANDVEKLETIVAKCKVLVNCCGPYHLLAENILTTCIISGTHYVDMSSDPYFNELMELKYHEKALQQEVFVISSCGFHSFPIEVAINFLKSIFQCSLGTLNSVEAFVRYNFGYYFYFPLYSIWTATSWCSLLWSCMKIKDLQTIRNQLREEHMPCLLPYLSIEELYRRSKYHEDGVMVHLPFLDQQTVERTQYTFYERNKERPIQFCKYIEFPSYIWAFIFIIWSLLISILAQFERTRLILNKYPKLFSLGMFSTKEPFPYLLEMSSYKIKICAKGWSGINMYPRLDINNSSILDRYMNVEISGENPFYGCGCLCLLISARTILDDFDKLPERGGVFTPGYAFQNINILEKFKNFSNFLRMRIL